MKAKDKNKIMLIISALMIVIAVIITCVATGVEYKKSKDTESGVSITQSTSESPKKDEPASNQSTQETKAPETTDKKTSAKPSETGAGKYKVATTDDPLGIRSEPDGGRIYEIPKGEEIIVEAVYGEWGYVTYDDVSGWVAMKYTELISADTNSSANTVGKHKIATQDDPLGIRTKPQQDAERNGEVPKGEVVEILAVNGDWGYVEYNGSNGWLSYKYLEKVS